MEQLEILMQIQQDVASIRAHNTDVERRIANLELSREKHDSRLRRVELTLLPISAGIGWICLHINNILK